MTKVITRGYDFIDFDKVWEFALDAHGKQTDKIGHPYEEHLRAVYANTKALGGGLDEQAAAILHDTIEDTKAVWADLEDIPVPDSTLDIVEAVTKGKSEHQLDYLDRIIAAGPGAMRVKLADLYHNTQWDRLTALTYLKKRDDYTIRRLLTKYARAVFTLEQELWIRNGRAASIEAHLAEVGGPIRPVTYSTGAKSSAYL